MKGFTQTDYLVAIGIFIFIFGFAVFTLTDHLARLERDAQLRLVTADAFELLTIADFNETPMGWPEAPSSPFAPLLFHFNENSSDLGGVRDGSGLGNNGTAAGPAFNISGARFGGAWTFDGVDDYIGVPDAPALNIIGSLTLAAWVFPQNCTGTEAIVAKDGDGSAYALLCTGSRIRFSLAGTNLDSSVISPRQWIAVAAVYDGSRMAIYLNGTLDTSTPKSGAVGTTALDLRIGGRPGGGSFFFGTLDEIVLYNRSLHDGDIRALAHPESRAERIGLASRAYRSFIKVNNSIGHWLNQSANHTALTNERVSIDLASLSLAGAPATALVFNATNHSVPYQLQGSNLTFVVPLLAANETMWFALVIDDDGIAPNRSTLVGGTNVLRETVMAPVALRVLDAAKMRALSSLDYPALRNALHAGEFRVRVTDLQSGADALVFGGQVPRRGTVVALQRFVQFYNSSGALRSGRLTVQTW